ncbi:peptide/nickel transport system ATP-binding protein [Marinitoga hydrogenitolerans DSM 16785]|uniref:Peptide/nickel transport system ATP-binding protein n=1 Tax=Marinitoga hydrogenitolerans (strain DSM 16785 / JCM 12826 / AT1271) TaxID=1122195 RepID=A0A1M4WHC8_MARH1|nr:ABC transporter ATP-binding protein [Marinitoga hydrogenitolerans]SHE80648.1 peptide/nickel transport system ATP-binding protein [Marinitoga hydrogenitolerans DSM 16785]
MILQIKNLNINYEVRNGFVNAVQDVNITLSENETLGLVGESGCGKSTLGKSLLKILPKNAKIDGEILFKNKNIAKYNEKEMRKIRGKHISMIFQDPMTSLNPIMKVKDLFLETIKSHYPDIPEEEALEMSGKILSDVGIDPIRMNEYSFQFSGGMRQRVMIALSLVLKPEIVIADEPTTSLDVIVQAQIMTVLKKLKDEHRMSMILITHDLGVVAELADRIGVMYAGHLVELSTAEKIYYEPKHPYTQALLKSIPNTNIEDRELRYIPGDLPNLVKPPKGCRFASRCPYAKSICHEQIPPDFEVEGTKVKCWLYEKVKV